MIHRGRTKDTWELGTSECEHGPTEQSTHEHMLNGRDIHLSLQALRVQMQPALLLSNHIRQHRPVRPKTNNCVCHRQPVSLFDWTKPQGGKEPSLLLSTSRDVAKVQLDFCHARNQQTHDAPLALAERILCAEKAREERSEVQAKQDFPGELSRTGPKIGGRSGIYRQHIGLSWTLGRSPR